MNKDQAKNYFLKLNERFQEQANQLNQLDAKVGDGDHGTTMARGTQAAAALMTNELVNAPDVFREAAKAFQKATGGASGILFSSVFQGIGSSGGEESILTLEHVHTGLTFAVARVQKLGRTSLGDKTMLDALLPASEAFSQTFSQGAEVAFSTAIEAAEQGAQSTIDLIAKSGRARYVAEGGKGNIDPGACSIVTILKLLQELWLENKSGENL